MASCEWDNAKRRKNRYKHESKACAEPAGKRGSELPSQSIEELAASRLTFQEIAAEYGEETAIQVGIARDPDAPELGEDWFRNARPASEVAPAVVERSRRMRGKQRAPTKEAISIRLDRDVLAYYRSTGKGWQGRVNETLRKYGMEAAQRASAEAAPEAATDTGAAPQP